MFENLLTEFGDVEPTPDNLDTLDTPETAGVGLGTEDTDPAPSPDLSISGMEHFQHLHLARPVRSEEELPGGHYQGAPQSEQLPYCPVFVYQDEQGHRHYTAKITGEIQELVQYLKLLTVLEMARPSDTVTIYIASPGGLVFTGTAISSAIAACQGKVITVARGLCASAGSLIWSAGHECRVEPFALFMYHMSSHMDYGNSGTIRAKAGGIVEYVKRVLRMAAVAKGHLTEEELVTLTETEENVYIDAKTMASRLGRIA